MPALLPPPLPLLPLCHSSPASPSVSPSASLSPTWCQQGAGKEPPTRHQPPNQASVHTLGISTNHALQGPIHSLHYHCTVHGLLQAALPLQQSFSSHPAVLFIALCIAACRLSYPLQRSSSSHP